jgi:hypothetical protein
MNASGIPYCLLSGYEPYPAGSDSDVDFMVRPEDGLRVTAVLREIGRLSDARFVQAIQHETGACYYVLAKQVGAQVAYLHPDCTTDYRRGGRLWLAADEVTANRRRFGTFFVPAVADEFQYYLIKKILKQQITKGEFQRVVALYWSHPDECSERLRRFWTKETTTEIVSALLGHDYERMQLHLGDLLAELSRSVPVEGCCRRGIQRLREWRRVVRRAFQPTGLRVWMHGGDVAQRADLARTLEQNLSPAFRRTRIVREGHSDGPGTALSSLLPKVRSTLIIRTKPASAMPWIPPGDICLDLSSKGHSTVESAIRTVLEAMAERLQRRIA